MGDSSALVSRVHIGHFDKNMNNLKCICQCNAVWTPIIKAKTLIQKHSGLMLAIHWDDILTPITTYCVVIVHIYDDVKCVPACRILRFSVLTIRSDDILCTLCSRSCVNSSQKSRTGSSSSQCMAIASVSYPQSSFVTVSWKLRYMMVFAGL